jgi:hypothetical protein
MCSPFRREASKEGEKTSPLKITSGLSSNDLIKPAKRDMSSTSFDVVLLLLAESRGWRTVWRRTTSLKCRMHISVSIYDFSLLSLRTETI